MLRGGGVALDQKSGAPGAPRESSGEAGPDDVAARIARLSPGQLECLHLVNEHLSSKEIAAKLGISPHTVDQRIRQALSILNVGRRSQAARIIAQFGTPYQRLIHQAPYLETETASDHPAIAVSHQIRHADRAGEIGGAGFKSEQRPEPFRSPLPPPFATRRNPRNEMTIGQRLFWIAAIGAGAAFSAGMYLAGLESLARLIKS